MENKKVAVGAKVKKLHSQDKGFREILKNRSLYALALPAVLWTLLFCYLPMIGIIIAFENFDPLKGLFGSQLVGLQNFQFFFAGQDWLVVTFNTIWLNILWYVTGTVVSLALAIMIAELGKSWIVRLIQSIMILPNFISYPIVGLFSISFLDSGTGVIDQLLRALHMHPIDFYGQAGVWPLLLTIVNIWKGAGFGAIVYLAVITGIDRELYEAAYIDGASRVQSIFRITLPMLKTTMIILFLLTVGNLFKGNLDMIYSMVGDNSLLFKSTDVIDTYVFRSLREAGSLGMTAAVGLFQSLMGFLLVIGSNKIVKKVEEDAALF